MEQITLQAEKRTIIGKQVKQLRRQGLVPAILYGHQTDPIPLQIEERALRQVLTKAGTSHLIALHIGKARKPRMILAREGQTHPITQALLHVDFQEVVMTEKITSEVPLVLQGQSPVVARKEGMLLQGVNTVEVRGLPANLIHVIHVDLSPLTQPDQAILVKDLEVGPEIEVLTDGEELVVKVLPVRAEEEEIVKEIEEREVEVITRVRAAREVGAVSE